MSVPTTFPVWMNKAGSPDMLVDDLASYNNALAGGYSYGATTPAVTIEAAPGATVVVIEDPVTPAQTDPGEQDQIS